MIKDEIEIKHIKEAGSIAKKAMEMVPGIVKPGATETEVAADIYNVLYKLGSEEPHVYVNSGSYPRTHSESLSTTKIHEGTFITVVISADRYYTNKSGDGHDIRFE